MNHKELHDKANAHLQAGWNYDAERSTAMQLGAIYELLDERLPAAPMTVIESAPAPVEDDPTEESGKFRCAMDNNDYIHIENSNFTNGAVKVTWEVDHGNDPYITLPPATARSLAYTLLRMVEV